MDEQQKDALAKLKADLKRDGSYDGLDGLWVLNGPAPRPNLKEEMDKLPAPNSPDA